ncbi:MAG TPA: hypothetical protein DEA08_08415 [Planctomycetes bacterium]|nr:hypothetical protein [Planctomycetota bacterium]
MSSELEAQLGRLAERSDELAEEGTLPRGALPALFRALVAAPAEEAVAALPALVERLADWPLLKPILELVNEQELGEPFLAAVQASDGRRGWCALAQAQALAEACPEPAWLPRALALLTEGGDPTELALAAGPARFGEALQAVLRARLRCPARRRDRTSARLAEGALAALVAVAPDEGAVQRAVSQVLAAETRRAASGGEPTLALAALDALGSVPAVVRLRLLDPLLENLQRRKVQTHAREVLEAAEAELGLTPAERLDLLARDGGADAEGWVEVDLEEGGVVRVGIDPAGELTREGQGECRADERAIESAEERLRATWDELAARLEQALAEDRRWSPTRWREVFGAGHPLWEDLSRRVVWTQGEQRFVRDEAGDPRDLFGEPCSLDEQEPIGLAYPLELDGDELELWREHARTRARRGPFPQVYRDVAPPPEDWRARFLGRQLHKSAVEESGWEGVPLLGAGPWELVKEEAGGVLRLEVEQVEIQFKATVQQRRAAHRRAREGEKAVVKRHAEAAPRVKITALEVEGEPGPRWAPERIRELERLSDPLAAPDTLWLRQWQQTKWKEPKESWREVVLRYREGSPALLEVRKALLGAFAALEGRELRIEDRFVITGNTVIELGTGACHEGPPKDYLPQWKVDERCEEAGELELPWPFRPASAPETVEVVERVLLLARHDEAAAAAASEDDEDDE